MESHDVDIPMDPITTNYTSPPPVLPLPSSSAAPFTTGTPLFQLPTALQPGEYRQKNASTTIFKIFEYGEGPAELRPKRLTQTDMFGRKHWRPTFLASSDTFVTHPWPTYEHLGVVSTIVELLEGMVWIADT